MRLVEKFVAHATVDPKGGEANLLTNAFCVGSPDSVLHQAVAALFPDPAQAGLTAQSARAALHGLVSLLLARPQFPFADHAVLVDAHLSHLIGWLGNRSPVLERNEDSH